MPCAVGVWRWRRGQNLRSTTSNPNYNFSLFDLNAAGHVIHICPVDQKKKWNHFGTALVEVFWKKLHLMSSCQALVKVYFAGPKHLINTVLLLVARTWHGYASYCVSFPQKMPKLQTYVFSPFFCCCILSCFWLPIPGAWACLATIILRSALCSPKHIKFCRPSKASYVRSLVIDVLGPQMFSYLVISSRSTEAVLT